MNNPCRKRLPSLIVVLVYLVLTGCVPYHFTDAPGVNGQVVSRATGRPIRGALVSMTAESKASTQVHTDQSGSFRLPALQHWGSIAYPSDGVSDGEGILRVEATGYQPYAGGSAEGGLHHGDTFDDNTAADLRHVRIALVPTL